MISARFPPLTLVRAAAFVAALAWLAMAPALPASAQNTEVQVAQTTSGPYEITVFAQPPEPVARLGSRFTVQVAGAADRQPVTGVDVIITMTSPSGATLSDRNFLRDPNRPGFYSSLITIPEEGLWKYTIAVEGAQGVGTVDGAVTASPPQGSGVSGVVFWGLLMMALVVGAFIAWTSMRRRGVRSRPSP